ncbi:MAG: glutamine--fructose-6-phosphate transaminase (isomerizing) [Proteobacteria bacterium]|nr:glutamine--fructose-6-phosphate transaminase (isomerizing) [Pseudomonadota bacterium]MBU4297841.1 glutamine--fructose-6-phosphate transaminase (isomerizing) [Pseudomonadota bacterium]MCG2746207.1 glutamine--fructose-6-phosphate transaminase (isomerizing) [Desulfobulbaceae bacterium]
MCGIVGYIGQRRVVPILLEGLKRLEYRGYDSAGLVYLQDGRLHKYRSEGKLVNLEEVMDKVLTDSTVGLGHTRWATHGPPSEANAHPHSDCSGELVVVHNGIIENFQTLREKLIAQGHVFTSQTDTEVLAHLIEEHLREDLVKAVREALKEVEGSFALGVMWLKQPDRLVAARYQSPLVLGVHEGGSFMASDIPALLPFTRDVIFLDDGEMAVLQGHTVQISRLDDGKPVEKVVQHIDWNAGMAEKSGYRHFMLKEIYEQPQSILDTFRGRLDPETGEVKLPEIGLSKEELCSIGRISLVACGTSWHAALVAKYWLEKWVGLPVEVDIASEFRYRRLLLGPDVIVIPISQSGETADTLAGLRLAKKLGSKVIAICNVVGSTITREADGTIYTHAGPEIGVASTKAFTSQLTALFLLTLFLGQVRGTVLPEKARELGKQLIELPGIIENELPRLQEELNTIAEEFSRSRDFLYLGRGANFPIALEGALKLKEISYIHAEGYAAGELKHGPIALIDRDMPVLALAPKDSVYGKLISNVEEVKARHGRMILVGSASDARLAQLSEFVIGLPDVHEDLTPLLYVIPLQLLSYLIANLRGCDVDQPRNLAKSVTVE